MSAYESYTQLNIPWLTKIPTHWKLLRNRDVFSEKSELVGDEYGKYTLLSLTTKGVIPRDLESGKGKFPKDFKSYKIVQEGDMVFCLFDIDETPRTVGLSRQEGMLTGAYTIFGVRNIRPEYALYYYISLDNIKALRALYSGLRKTIKTEVFLSAKLPIPPVEAQDKIIQYLNWQTSRMNKLISAKREEIKKVQEAQHVQIRKKIMGMDKGNELVNTGIPWAPYAPCYWKKEKYRNLFTEVNVKVGDKSKEYTLLSLTTNGVIVRDISSGKGKFPSDFSSYQEVLPGQFVFCLFDVDETPRTVGLSEEKGMITGAYTVLNCNGANPEYLLWYFTVLDDEKAFKPIYSGLRKVINIDTFMRQFLFLPPREEQDRIVQEIKEICNKNEHIISVFRREIEMLSDLKKQIISSVVTGQIDVRNIGIPDYEFVDEDVDTDTEEETESEEQEE